MKILEVNGFKYSREEFEGYKFRSIFKFEIDNDYNNTISIHIYTNNSDKEEVKKVIDSRKGNILCYASLDYKRTRRTNRTIH